MLWFGIWNFFKLKISTSCKVFTHCDWPRLYSFRVSFYSGQMCNPCGKTITDYSGKYHYSCISYDIFHIWRIFFYLCLFVWYQSLRKSPSYLLSKSTSLQWEPTSMSNKNPILVISCVVGINWAVWTSKTDACVTTSSNRLLTLRGWLVINWSGMNECRIWKRGLWRWCEWERMLLW